MYSSDPKSTYEKYTAAAPASADYPCNGIPVNYTNQYNTDNHDSHRPRPPLHPRATVPWSTGLFDCFSDVTSCCLTYWCPCITFGRIAEIVDKGSISSGVSRALYAQQAYVTGCACIFSSLYREKMRQQHNLEESPCSDYLVHFFCEECALCQEYRELQNRGFNMEIGWQGNVEKKNRKLGMTPVVEEGMTR